MKDITEFFDKLKNDNFSSNWIDTVNQANISCEFPLTKDNVNSFIMAINKSNMLMTLEILEQYHEWLNSPTE